MREFSEVHKHLYGLNAAYMWLSMLTWEMTFYFAFQINKPYRSICDHQTLEDQLPSFWTSSAVALGGDSARASCATPLRGFLWLEKLIAPPALD